MPNPAGLALEEKFFEWLALNQNELSIDDVEFLSLENKASEYDFLVLTEDEAYYFDVVGYYPHGDTYRLNTTHKSWSRKLNWLKEYGIQTKTIVGGFLAFTFDNGERWRFYKIHNRLPEGDLTLTKERQKNLLTAGWLFCVHGKDITELKEWARSQAEDRAEDLKLTTKDQIQELYNDLVNEWIEFNKI